MTDDSAVHRRFQGTPVVAGAGYGPVIRPGARPAPPLPREIAPDQREAEIARLQSAVSVVADRLKSRAAAATGSASEVLAANAAMAADRGWLRASKKAVDAGHSAERAALAATDQFAAMFVKAGERMAERVTDLRDVCSRIVAELLGEPEPGVIVPETPSVLLAEDLAPADTAGLDASRILALATSRGGPTSHTAIIARQKGIPCVVAVDGLDEVPVGAVVLVDGATGVIELDPDRDVAEAAVAAAAETASKAAGWSGPGRTSDGHEVDILANVQDGSSARKAAETPAAGIGLFRTELSFLDRDTEPSVDEQAAVYREVVDAFPGRKVVIRTLDAGSDKPMRFVNHPDEDNPSLGVRGIRIAFGNPGILDRQLDALEQAAEGAERAPWVMAPMIATAAEAADFAAKVRERGLTPGVMIEVPAAALLADRILEHVDFLSIGTNDLTQYTMAADRMSSELAALTDPWQPAVLALVGKTAAAGQAVGKPVGVCGEAAADPLLACVLVGLGVTSLSAASTAVSAVGARLGETSLAACRRAAAAALATADPAQARAAAEAALAG